MSRTSKRIEIHIESVEHLTPSVKVKWKEGYLLSVKMSNSHGGNSYENAFKSEAEAQARAVELVKAYYENA